MRLECEAILFDNDGVLVDSHEAVDQAWRQLAREFDLDMQALLTELAGVRAIDTLERHLPPHRVALAVARLEELEVALAGSVRPLPGAIELIARLPVQRYSIVTSASRRLAEARWRGAGIAVPPAAVTADDVAAGKPHPEPFLTAARCLGVDPARCIVFEDSVAGATAGRTAGATVVAVGGIPWPVDPPARVHDLSQVDVQIDGVAPLVLELAG